MNMNRMKTPAVIAALGTALSALPGLCVVTPVPIDLQGMIDAAPKGGTVTVSAGDWETKPFRLKGDLTLRLEAGATLHASTNLADYAGMAHGKRYFIYAEGAENLSIVGEGVIDGRGGAFREKGPLAGESQPQALPVQMRFSRCRNLTLEGFTYRNGGAWGCHLRNCDGVTMRRVKCFNHVNNTNDGIDIESRNVLIEDCDIDADDDAIAIKTESDRDFAVENVTIRNCRLASCCNAVKFGTGSYCDFRNVTVENCAFVRPKGNYNFAWWKRYPGVTNRLCGIAGIALEVVDGGRLEDVTFRTVTIEGYMVPIFARLGARRPPRAGRETYLRNVLIENVKGVADSFIANSITGVPGLKPRNIVLRNVELSLPGGGTYGDRTRPVPEMERSYPEATMFHTGYPDHSVPREAVLPAYGFYVRHAEGIVFENVRTTLRFPDRRDECVFDDADVKVIGADRPPLPLVPYPASLKETGGTSQVREAIDETDASLGPEGYRLTVTTNAIRIASSAAAGAFYARRTLDQLRRADGTYPCVEIADAPRFRWRGVLLDESRHFYGKETVKRILDQMAAFKLNVFHWHLVDSHGWRMPIDRYPELTTRGATRPVPDWDHWVRDADFGAEYGPYCYTKDEIREVVVYAAARHIKVVPEIEIPGHSREIIICHPSFSCLSRDAFMDMVRSQNDQDQAAALCLGNDEVIRFLENVIDEMVELFPGDIYHIGGDECPRGNWKTCPKCQARMKAEGLADEDALQSWVTRHFVAYLAKKGKRTIGWDEILQGGLAEGACVMSWRGAEGGIAAANAGHEAVMCPHLKCYLDYPSAQWGDPCAYPRFGEKTLLPLENVYSLDPLEGIPAAQRKFILGTQSLNWGESTWCEKDLLYKMWPRTCANAEIAWTGAKVRTYADFVDRLSRVQWPQARDDRPWLSDEERAFLRPVPTYGLDWEPGTPEGNDVRRYLTPDRTKFVEFNYDESKAGSCALENPLRFASGRAVMDRDDWPARRRELLDVFSREVYGRMPPPPEGMAVRLLSERVQADGKVVERRYRQWFYDDCRGPSIDWIVLLPAAAAKPSPVIVQLNYKGNDEIAAGRNGRFGLPIEEIAARGYAFVSARYTQFTSDPKNAAEFRDNAMDGVCALWGPRDPKRTDNPGALMIWAWGYLRGLDLAARIPGIDAKRNVVIGWSRLGKAALLAAAYDERCAVCVPNQTGAIGVQLMKRNYGETLEGQRIDFPHWYCSAVWKYAGDPTKQPFDQHLLLACVAPRALLIEGYHKKWFDPRGEFLSAKGASPVWEFLCGKGLGVDEPPVAYDDSCVKPPFGFVRREGIHGLSPEDWGWALDFADKAFD